MLILSDRRAARFEQLLEAIAGKLEIIIETQEYEVKELDDLALEVATDTEVESSAIKLINGLAAQIAAAGTDPVKLTALTDQLTQSSTALAAAVKANTTPTPTPPSTSVAIVSGIAPTSGPVAGGDSIVLTGTGFTGATGVTFGGIAGINPTVVDDTTINVTSPSHSAGPGAQDVVVTTPAGVSAAVPFTYV